MISFDDLQKIIHKENLLNRKHDYEQAENNGENAFIEFKLFCNAFGKQQNQANFIEWEKKNPLNFWQKKHLFQKYFNYVFEYDHDKEKWNAKTI